MYDEDNIPVEIRGCMNLWVAVLHRAFLDMALVDPVAKDKKTEAKQVREYAREWCMGGTPYFNLVCEFAGYDPAFIRERAKAFLECGASVDKFLPLPPERVKQSEIVKGRVTIKKFPNWQK